MPQIYSSIVNKKELSVKKKLKSKRLFPFVSSQRLTIFLTVFRRKNLKSGRFYGNIKGAYNTSTKTTRIIIRYGVNTLQRKIP